MIFIIWLNPRNNWLSLSYKSNWKFYSENIDGTVNEEGERFTARPKNTDVWKSLSELLDYDSNIRSIGYKLADNEPAKSGTQGCKMSRI